MSDSGLTDVSVSSQVQAILEAWLHPNTSSSSLSAWVAPEEEKASREDHSSQFKPPSSCSPFQRPLDPDLWVVPAKTLTPALGSGGQPHPTEEEDKWLLKKRSQAQVTGPEQTSTDQNSADQYRTDQNSLSG